MNSYTGREDLDFAEDDDGDNPLAVECESIGVNELYEIGNIKILTNRLSYTRFFSYMKDSDCLVFSIVQIICCLWLRWG